MGATTKGRMNPDVRRRVTQPSRGSTNGSSHSSPSPAFQVRRAKTPGVATPGGMDDASPCNHAFLDPPLENISRHPEELACGFAVVPRRCTQPIFLRWEIQRGPFAMRRAGGVVVRPCSRSFIVEGPEATLLPLQGDYRQPPRTILSHETPTNADVRASNFGISSSRVGISKSRMRYYRSSVASIKSPASLGRADFPVHRSRWRTRKPAPASDMPPNYAAVQSLNDCIDQQ